MAQQWNYEVLKVPVKLQSAEIQPEQHVDLGWLLSEFHVLFEEPNT